jgi:lysophospholipase L1-like esterase
MADKLVAEAVKKYKDVYLIDSNADDPNQDTSADGVHPAEWGYHLWAESVRGPILKILKKYGIK